LPCREPYHFFFLEWQTLLEEGLGLRQIGSGEEFESTTAFEDNHLGIAGNQALGKRLEAMFVITDAVFSSFGKDMNIEPLLGNVNTDDADGRFLIGHNNPFL